MANFKFMLKIFKSGFSLIELMISLIIISLIAAAFVPVITKKLARSSIVAGSFGNNSSGGVSENCSNISEDCALCAGDTCLSCKKTCSAGETLDTTNCTCKFKGTYYIPVNGLHVTKFAMGDSKYTQIPDSAGVKVVDKNTACGSSSEKYYTAKCCWKATIDDSSYCNSNNGSYSGCERTVCTWAAANAICENYKQDGKTWRLPSTSETSAWWGDYSVGKGDDGLMLCATGSTNTSQYFSSCTSGFSRFGDNKVYYECVYDGIQGKRCNLDRIWNKEEDVGYNMHYTAWAASEGVYGNWREQISWLEPSTVRCVSDIVPNCETYAADGETCIACKDGYYLSNNQCKVRTTVANCATYSTTADKCESCSSGYKLSNNTCVSDFDCSGKYFMKIGNLCVTKYNMGDSDETAIPSEARISVVNIGTRCGNVRNYTDKCCWKGATSGTPCNSANSDYSTCNRLACNWMAANAICAHYKKFDKHWRLPELSEMSNWYTNSNNKGNDGLMLCDDSSTSSLFCASAGVCSYSYSNYCYVSAIYSSDLYSNTRAYVYSLSGGSWSSHKYIKTEATSVRCVTEM